MSMHKIPLTQLEEDGLRAHGLDIGSPSQLSDVFRHGIKWALEQAAPQPEQSGLVETLERVKLTDEEARHHSFSAVAYWNNAVTACISALSATPSPAMDAKEE